VTHRGAGPTVLLVEDNERNMKLLRDVLRATGYRPVEASTGRQAVALAVEQRPVLVLMDMRLPDFDGVEALGRLRADERTAAVAVVAITAQAMQGDRERLIAAGFDGYLPKPLDVDELLATVARHCGPGGLQARAG
jgi:two-component system cell cycle response regulator DivK